LEIDSMGRGLVSNSWIPFLFGSCSWRATSREPSKSNRLNRFPRILYETGAAMAHAFALKNNGFRRRNHLAVQEREM
ncbi:MAG: hypothetical protein OEV77_12905, partial [Nitrospira sp.]|nr:hypothetical protein [Nitrospira sp.]